MTTSTQTLADFLLARIAEDEAAAKAATSGPWLTHEMDSIFVGNQADGRTSGLWEIVHMSADSLGDLKPEAAEQDRADAAHIARHDPARVIAECKAKRRIVERFAWAAEKPDLYRNDMEIMDEWQAAMDTLTDLALPYADRPGFREEWRA